MLIFRCTIGVETKALIRKSVQKCPEYLQWRSVLKGRGYCKQSKLDGGKAWEWEWCGSVYQTRYYLHYTASNLQWFDAKVHSICSTTPICENTLNVPSDNTCFPHARVPYKHNLKQIIVFCFHSNRRYHNFKVCASSSGVCNSVAAHMKAGWQLRRVKKMWQMSRNISFSTSSSALKPFLKCASSPLTYTDHLNCLLGFNSPYMLPMRQVKWRYHCTSIPILQAQAGEELLNTSQTHF